MVHLFAYIAALVALGIVWSAASPQGPDLERARYFPSFDHDPVPGGGAS